jgi:hypothetical protein
MSEEKKLLKVYRALGDEQRRTLYAFAEFLATREPETATVQVVVPEPNLVPRPEKESVVKAIKRLMSTYHMLERNKLLHETSGFMTKHLIHGKPADEVIDELEVMFARHYERFKEESK